MTVHLLHSAVMPQPGCYQLDEIDAETFAAKIKDAAEKQHLRHYIGYKSTLTLIEQLVGIDMGELRFEKVAFAPDDLFLVARLKYLPTREQKIKDNPDIRDFEFFRGSYLKLNKNQFGIETGMNRSGNART